jgi:predicted CoA-binding protein
MTDQSPSAAGWENPAPAEIERIITGAKTIAVVGLSSNESKASHRVAGYLAAHGFDIIPVNPVEAEILGRKSYPDLASIGRSIDIVDVFRRSEDTPAVIKEAIAVGAKCVWLQKGVVSEEAYQLARRAGVRIVMDRCLKEEHTRLSTQ